jgi:hypothetical protein
MTCPSVSRHRTGYPYPIRLIRLFFPANAKSPPGDRKGVVHDAHRDKLLLYLAALGREQFRVVFSEAKSPLFRGLHDMELVGN